MHPGRALIALVTQHNGIVKQKHQATVLGKEERSAEKEDITCNRHSIGDCFRVAV